MWHFIDIELLKNKLLESVYYFHYQPPIFNLFLGIIHKQSLISPKLILQLIFLLSDLFYGGHHVLHVKEQETEMSFHI